MNGFEFVGGVHPAGLPDSLASAPTLATLRYSTHGYMSRPTDTLANIPWPPRIVEGVSIEQAVGLLPGRGAAAIGFGEIALDDSDGVMRALAEGYTIDGRAVTLRAAPAKGARIGNWPALDSFATFFAGTAAGWRPDTDVLRVRLRDQLHRLEVKLQSALYAGTGGVEGGADLAGKPKPMAWGRVYNAPVVPLGVIDLGFGLLYTYHAHYRRGQGVPVCRANGAVLTQVQGVPGIGQYVVVNSAAGMFVQIGFTPNNEIITADIEGDATPYFASTAGRIVRRMMMDLGAITGAEIDLMSFEALEASRPGEIGWWQGPSERSLRGALEEILAGVDAFLTTTRGGLFRVAALGLGGPSRFTLDVASIDSIAPLPLPEEIDPPPRRVRALYRRNWAPLSQIAGGVDSGDRVALTQQWRADAVAFSDRIALAWALAGDMELPTLFWNRTDAEALAAARHAFHAPQTGGAPRRAFRVTTGRYLRVMEMALRGTLTWPDWGLASGWTGTVYRWREDVMAGELEFDIYG